MICLDCARLRYLYKWTEKRIATTEMRCQDCGKIKDCVQNDKLERRRKLNSAELIELIEEHNQAMRKAEQAVEALKRRKVH